MDEDILNDVDASQDQVVDGQESVADTDGSGGSESEVKKEVAVPSKQTQTPEENSAFKEMRLQIEALKAETENVKLQAKRDAIYATKYAELGFKDEDELRALYADEGITSYEDLDKYYQSLEKAEKLEMSPQAFKELETVKQQLEALTKEKQDLVMAKELEKVKADMTEQYGEMFTQNEEAIMDLAERMGMKNANGIKASMATVIADNFPKLMKEYDEKLAKAKEDGVKEFIEKRKSETPIEGSGSSPSQVGTKPKDAWATARQGAMNILNGSR